MLMSKPDPYFKLRPSPETPEDEICKCAEDKPMKLMGALSCNPLHCIDCNLEVFPESLPRDQVLVDAVASWRRTYDDIDWLWLQSGEYEAWAKDQLVDMTSPVNQRGMALCEELSLLRKCYYCYFQDDTAEGFKPITLCPACQQTLKAYGDGIFPQLICEECRIITVGA